ncbi:MAG TPA: hypothetical protein VFW77_03980 [Candidatus Saccharimonadales bacterium]|nr:hypothetical protein [Candidatus Saccharimonadales bacterium]
MGSTIEQEPVRNNPLSGIVSPWDVNIVRAGADTEPLIVITDAFRQTSLETRSAVGEMVEASLGSVDPAMFGPEEKVSPSRRTSTKLERIKESELLTLTGDVDDPQFSLRAMIAISDTDYAAGRRHTATVFDGRTPILHAGFRDEEYNDEWVYYWDGVNDDEAPESFKFNHPSIGFIIGNTELAEGDMQDAIASLFVMVESRQNHHAGSLTEFYSGQGPSGPPHEKTFEAMTFGTVPRSEFTDALGALAANPDALKS